MPVNALLVRWQGGWIETTDTDGITAAGRREAFLSLGAIQSAYEAGVTADRQLAVFADTRSAVTADLEPISTADTPYLAFQVGDTITVPDEAGDPTEERLRALTVSMDEDGNITYVPELRDRIADLEQRRDQALKKMDNGTLRGQSRVSSPVSSPLPPNPCCLPTVPVEGGGGQ